MRRLIDAMKRLARDEYGGDAIEYAMIVSMIIIVLLVALTNTTDAVVTTFNHVDTSINDV